LYFYITNKKILPMIWSKHFSFLWWVALAFTSFLHCNTYTSLHSLPIHSLHCNTLFLLHSCTYLLDLIIWIGLNNVEQIVFQWNSRKCFFKQFLSFSILFSSYRSILRLDNGFFFFGRGIEIGWIQCISL
jgi:hypothetical protein